jgi:hypothetical protein
MSENRKKMNIKKGDTVVVISGKIRQLQGQDDRQGSRRFSERGQGYC